MCEIKNVTDKQMEAIARPLPAKAVSPHPTKKFLSSIKSIYVTERLNEVFGVGKWKVETEVVDKEGKMVVVKLKFSIPEYGIYYECFGGNDNSDLGDAYKGATTDAITKVASWLGIGSEVFKGKAKTGQPETPSRPKQQPRPEVPQNTKKRLTAEIFDDKELLDKLLSWMYGFLTTEGYPKDFDPGAHLLKFYEADGEVLDRFSQLFESYRQARNNSR